MKKLIVFIFLIILLCLTNLNYISDFKFKNIFPKSSVELFVECVNDNELKNCNYIKNGTGKIVFINIDKLDEFLKNNEVLGFTIKVKHMQLNDVFKRLEIKRVKKIQNSYYGVSAKFSKHLKVGNESYNFECVYVNDEIHIGTPILLGSY